MKEKDYSFYTAKDFAMDEEFQQWIIKPDIKSRYFWNHWLEAHPEKQATVDEAAALVRTIRFQPYSMTNRERDELWDSINEDMEEDEIPVISPASLHPGRNWKKITYVAATIMGIVVLAGILKTMIFHQKQTVSYTVNTQFGEVKKFLLPDSSSIILNADSRLVYTEDKHHVRSVWLDGEAFFKVRHTIDENPFIVHTFDNLSVTVLGTEFNVNTFGKKISVVLQQGSIKLDINSDSANSQTQLYLKPGEMVTYHKSDGDYTKSRVNAGNYVSWSSGRLIMENYTLRDAGRFMKQVFGKEIIVHNNRLLKKKVSGSMPISYNADTMMMQFKQVFKIHYHTDTTGNKIIISDN